MSTPLTAAELTHRALLERWRGAMDLVGPGPLELHFEDSALAVEGLGADGTWADLGSGAGFPGVALAARYPASRVLLVESRQKRGAFLRQVVRETGLSNVEVVNARVEALTARFDGVVSRAFAPPPAYLAQAERLLLPGGRALLLFAGGDAPDGGAGLQLESVRSYRVAGRPRSVATYRRA